MKLRPGARLRSQVDATEIIIVRAPKTEIVLACGGHPMIDPKTRPEPGLTAAADSGDAVKLGKRYVAEGRDDLEVLVTKAGTAGVTVDGAPVAAKDAKPLPASD